MIAINHALTGAVIGLVVANPVVALPAALLSHIVCDMIPHFGTGKGEAALASKGFARYLVVDATFCGVLVLLLAISQPLNWQLAAVCAFVAASPDFISIRRFAAIRKKAKFIPNALEQFLTKIQWFEKPIGGLVETAWLVCATTLLWQFL